MSLPNFDLEDGSDDDQDLRRPDMFVPCGRSRYRCRACPAAGILGLRKTLRHEDTDLHVRRVRDLDNAPPSTDPLAAMMAPSSPSAVDGDRTGSQYPSHPPTVHTSFGPADVPSPANSGLRQVVTETPELDFPPPITVHGPALPSDSPDQLFDDFSGLLGAAVPERPPGDLPKSYSAWWKTQRSGASDNGDEIDLFDAISSVGSSAPPSEFEDSDTDDSEAEESASPVKGQGSEAEDLLEHAPSDGVRAVNNDEWWPWQNEKECLTDLLSAFPRAVFSESELEITRWFATKLGVKKLPKTHALKQRRAGILKLAGTEPRLVEGSLGHLYSVASLAKILADEMSNPKVRPHLRFLPQDNDHGHTEARHGARWRQEVDPNLAGPMVRAGDQDFFVEEPCLANIDDLGTLGPVWPTRWFERGEQTYATAHLLCVDSENGTYTVDATQCRELPLSAFVLSYPRLAAVHTYYGLPHPKNVLIGDDPTGTLRSCSDTVPNPWRTKAAGLRVMSLPLWLYCDDTSGNVSKKWNKHNSFLFILAGLLQQQSLKPYNIHFLSTSNLASPLEMLEAIAADIKEFQTNGLRVWDCVYKQYVLLIPWVLAFLGDNPMQSELASHIGLNGKFFCRVCQVQGKAKERPSGTLGEIDRVSEFMKAGTPRRREKTLSILKKQIQDIKDGVPSRVEPASTQSGIKDKHFVPIFQELSATCTSIREENKKLGKNPNEGLDEALKKVLRNRTDEELLNPIFLVRDIDPHADTPVEILHVILLGIVKYFWRDAVSRQNSVDRKILRTRLNSLDVSALGLSRLQGDTLVNYAGSLTGRDFRVVVQVAPAVLHGLLPEAAYDAWLALSRLAPLIFQPSISNLDEYLVRLRVAIDNFLGATALWSIQWFNKPKFHVLLHSPNHIRRFGPAILTATEGFESYNLVIRLRSVHSNRHAPSIDISASMSFMHAARHLVSGGLVWDDEIGKRRAAGAYVQDLLKDRAFVKMMNMTDLEGDVHPGFRFRPADSDIVQFEETLTAAATSARWPSSSVEDQRCVVLLPKVNLANGDVAHKGHFVLFDAGADVHGHALGRVKEILATRSRPYGFLVEKWNIGDEVLPYRMPSISSRDELSFVAYNHVRCCIHTFHNCKRQGCQASRTRVLVQERRSTQRRDLEYRHEAQPDDLILNFAQLRSAALTQELRRPPTFPDQYKHLAGRAQPLVIVGSETNINDSILPAQSLRYLVECAVRTYEAQKEMPPPGKTTNPSKRKSTTSSTQGRKRPRTSQAGPSRAVASTTIPAATPILPARALDRMETAVEQGLARVHGHTYGVLSSPHGLATSPAIPSPSPALASRTPDRMYMAVKTGVAPVHGHTYGLPSLPHRLALSPAMIAPSPAMPSRTPDYSYATVERQYKQTYGQYTPVPGEYMSTSSHPYEAAAWHHGPMQSMPAAGLQHLNYHHGYPEYRQQDNSSHLGPTGIPGPLNLPLISPNLMPTTPVLQSHPTVMPSTPRMSKVTHYPPMDDHHTARAYRMGGPTFFSETPWFATDPGPSDVSHREHGQPVPGQEAYHEQAIHLSTYPARTNLQRPRGN